jgi:DNA-binding MarR family transcriptional regulator
MKKKYTDYPKVFIQKTDLVDETTGECVEGKVAVYPSDVQAYFKHKNHSIKSKKKKVKPFSMTTRLPEITDLSNEEAGILYKFILFIGWEDNHIQKDGKLLNISEIAQELKYSRQYIHKIVKSLEEKGFLTLVGNAREKHILISSHVMWHGKESNRT